MRHFVHHAQSHPCRRRAYELAFATAYMFAGAKPRFVMVDDVAFQRPVEVSNLLRLHSTVLHTTTQQGDTSMVRLHDLCERELLQ